MQEKKWFFIYQKIAINKCRRPKQNRHLTLDKKHSASCGSKNSVWMLKLVGKTSMKQDIWIVLRYLLIKELLITKRKIRTFTGKKTGWVHVSHVIAVSITSNTTYWPHALPDMTHRLGHRIPAVFLPKMHIINQVMRKYCTDLKCWAFYKWTGQESSKVSKSWETDWGSEELFQMKGK